MSNGNTTQVNGGCGCGTAVLIVTCLLVIFKLTELIQIEWWLVFTPMAVYLLVVGMVILFSVGVIIVAFVGALIASLLDN